jgi:chromosome partitioning protein
MNTVAIYHIKGGVGKTATAVNLAYLAALSGQRVLLWDLDPQAASSFYFRVKPKIKGGGKRLLHSDADIFKAIKASDYENLDILPADFSYRKMDHQLETKKTLKRALEPLREAYDLILLDCPPNITYVSENIFRACDAMAIPVIPTILSLRTLEQLTEFFKAKELTHIKMMPFFSIVDSRRQLHRDIMTSLPAQVPTLLKTYIPNATEVERMGVKRKPLPVFANSSKASKAYCYLLAEMMGRLGRNDEG